MTLHPWLNYLMEWPVIIKHAGDAELIYIRDQTDWENNREIQQATYHESDVLIDSRGHIFSLTTVKQQLLKPEPRDELISLEELLGLVKAHAAQNGSCCVAKLYAPTIKDALGIVASLDET